MSTRESAEAAFMRIIVSWQALWYHRIDGFGGESVDLIAWRIFLVVVYRKINTRGLDDVR